MPMPTDHRRGRIAVVIIASVGILVVIAMAVVAFLYLNVWWKPGS